MSIISYLEESEESDIIPLGVVDHSRAHDIYEVLNGVKVAVETLTEKIEELLNEDNAR